VASFTATPTNGKRPLTVNFLSTSTSGCVITSYVWNFNDGTTSAVQNPTHVFTFTGGGNSAVFNVTLTVANQSGTSAPVTTTITVTK
jgi:PKD repeat protein